MMPLVRALTAPFRSELYLFLSLSLLSLTFGVFESILYSNFFDDPEDSTEHSVSQHSGKSQSRQNMLETKSTFFIATACLFGIVYIVIKATYYLFFGQLSDPEQTRLSRMLFKFIILRSIILSGAVSVSYLPSVFCWLVWFSALGITHSCALVANVRCSRFSASSRISLQEWARMVFAVIFLFTSSCCLLVGGLSNRHLLADVRSVEMSSDGLPRRSLVNSVNSPTAIGIIVARLTGYNQSELETVDVSIYLVSEVALVSCLVLHLLGGLSIQAYDRWKLARGQTWPDQNLYSYYFELFHVLVFHFVEIVHYSHLLLWSRIFSVASLIVFLHIRSAYSLFANRIKRHLAYRRLSKFIQDNYFLCTTDNPNGDKLRKSDTFDDENKKDAAGDPTEKHSGDVCAICWELMLTWRRLPCRHNFHESCLRSWLEQNPSCPTCRRDLSIPPSVVSQANRNTTADQFEFGMFLRDFTRATRTAQAVPTVHQVPPNANRLTNRNLFAAAVGLNLGLSIGSAPIVTAAAQAVARETAPTTSVSGISSGPSDVSANSEERGSPGLTTSTSTSSTTTETIQPNPTNAVAPSDDANQVLRRSFHFDGSRYFSWLPSLHVELSEVIREVFSPGTSSDQATQPSPQITPQPTTITTDSTGSDPASFNPDAYELIRLPNSLRAPAQEIATMFPQFSLSDIVADLLITGMPEATVENLIQRPAPSIQVTPRAHPDPVDQSTQINVNSNRTTPSTSFTTSSGNLIVERRREMLENARQRFLSNNPPS